MINGELDAGEESHGEVGRFDAIHAPPGADDEGRNVPGIDKFKSPLPVQHNRKKGGKTFPEACARIGNH